MESYSFSYALNIRTMPLFDPLSVMAEGYRRKRLKGNIYALVLTDPQGAVAAG